MVDKYRRHIVAYADYFKNFRKTLPKKDLAKLYHVFLYIMALDRIPIKYFKAVTSVRGLYEIRVECEGRIYRVFCCLDEEQVVLFNAFQKKTRKTPQGEIELAKRIMLEYYSKGGK